MPVSRRKNAISFTGVECNAKQSLENLPKSGMEYVSGMELDSTFSSFQSAL